jgi:hypothetical protein
MRNTARPADPVPHGPSQGRLSEQGAFGLEFGSLDHVLAPGGTGISLTRCAGGLAAVDAVRRNADGMAPLPGSPRREFERPGRRPGILPVRDPVYRTERRVPTWWRVQQRRGISGRERAPACAGRFVASMQSGITTRPRSTGWKSRASFSSSTILSRCRQRAGRDREGAEGQAGEETEQGT